MASTIKSKAQKLPSNTVSETEGSASKPASPRKKICIDPGHGGAQPGAVSPKYRYQEKKIALDISLKVRDYILYASLDKDGSPQLNDYCLYPHTPIADVVMTREKDLDISLKDRCTFSNAEKSSMFVSIHCNSCNSEDPNGIETWCYPSDGSRRLASSIQKAMLESVNGWTIRIKGKEQGIKSRGVKETTVYYTLKNTNAPSVVVECGFMSNPAEASLMYGTEQYRVALARGIALGILRYALGV